MSLGKATAKFVAIGGEIYSFTDSVLRILDV
jgi:hypothetical protein